jgi:hypothetical protein
MASTESSAPANGTAHYDSFQQQGAQPAQQAAAEIPKDEVGWYFVEQYYTTLSKSPERLYVSRLPPAARAALHVPERVTDLSASSSTTSVPSMSLASRRRRSASAWARRYVDGHTPY